MTNLSASDLVGVVLWFAVLGLSAAIIADVVGGLVRTGRGSEPRIVGGYVQVSAKAGGFYFVARDGAWLLRGDTLDNAVELQAKFAGSMVRAGEQPAA